MLTLEWYTTTLAFASHNYKVQKYAYTKWLHLNINEVHSYTNNQQVSKNPIENSLKKPWLKLFDETSFHECLIFCCILHKWCFISLFTAKITPFNTPKPTNQLKRKYNHWLKDLFAWFKLHFRKKKRPKCSQNSEIL